MSADKLFVNNGKMAQRSFSRGFFFGLSLLFCMVILWIRGIFVMPADLHQGDVYKIIYLHVPSAFSSFFCAGCLFVVSLLSFQKKPPQKVVYWGKSACEVGLLFTLITLVSGSVWGKPTWGTWWTWDARLTTTLVLGFLYGGYLLLWQSLEPQLRLRTCGILGILISLDVPIIYKSVTWWRTLHQPPTLLAQGGAVMSQVMLIQLCLCSVMTLVFCFWLIVKRKDILSLEQDLEEMESRW